MYEIMARDMELKVPILSQKQARSTCGGICSESPLSLFIATFAQARENEIYLADLYWDLPYLSCTRNLPCP